jgi:hypothetical protein
MKRTLFVAIVLLVLGFAGPAMASNCPDAPKPKPVVHHAPKPEHHEPKTHKPAKPAKHDDDDQDEDETVPPPVVVVVTVTPPTFVDDTPPTVTHEAPPVPCEESEPCWDCATMGNRICGPAAVDIGTPEVIEQAPEPSAPVFEQQDSTPAAPVAVPALAYTGANIGRLLGIAGIFIACGVMILLTIRAKRENG